MSRFVVVDIGNSRVKFALVCQGELHPDFIARLPPNAPEAWEHQLRQWNVTRASWRVASVHPERLAELRAWIESRQEPIRVVSHFTQIPVPIQVDFPERVGLDRLLNALAATSHLPKSTPAVIVDAGTAVTVDWLDEQHIFQGGAILPGPRLMFDSLHRHTAKLPPIDTHHVPDVPVPGKHTQHAMEAGVMAAQIGAIEFLLHWYAEQAQVKPWLLLTGGALGALADYKFPGVEVCRTDPLLTLKGIQRATGLVPSEGLSCEVGS